MAHLRAQYRPRGTREKVPAAMPARPAIVQKLVEGFRDAREEAPARSEAWLPHADARAAADLVFVVEQVDDVEAHLEIAQRRQREGMRDAEIELRIARHVAAVRDHLPARQDKLFAQSRT